MGKCFSLLSHKKRNMSPREDTTLIIRDRLGRQTFIIIDEKGVSSIGRKVPKINHFSQSWWRLAKFHLTIIIIFARLIKVWYLLIFIKEKLIKSGHSRFLFESKSNQPFNNGNIKPNQVYLKLIWFNLDNKKIECKLTCTLIKITLDLKFKLYLKFLT